ncbi:hypothetical protein GQ44DRAFT_707930 [Phaeosphaeriaceae sp. PMI808]|nr:hypothetical protein GQ44DRAFT_707930 [Phaeosphaeriaceae sp. PMI808]
MELGADDSLIAPDGQLALRLAATNGHREVVAFLPRRRGGGYKRWKVKHTTAMRRCKKVVHSIYTFSKFFAWDVPRFFIWTVPKHVIVLPLIKSNKWLHEHGEEIPGMIVKGLREMRIGITKIPGAIWKAIKSIPRFIESVVKAIGRGLSACAKGIWKVIKSLPHAAKLTLVWIWTGVKNAGSAMANVFKSIISFIHTVCAAIFGFFRRITLQDVWQGLLACLRTVFVNVPKKIWEWLCKFGEASKQGLEALFGTLGKCMWYLVRIIWELIVYIPEKIGEILAACGSSLRSGGKEMLVWIDPKRV